MQVIKSIGPGLGVLEGAIMSGIGTDLGKGGGRVCRCSSL